MFHLSLGTLKVRKPSISQGKLRHSTCECSILKAGLSWELAGLGLLSTACLRFPQCERKSSEMNPVLPHTEQNLSFLHESQFPHLSNGTTFVPFLKG